MQPLCPIHNKPMILLNVHRMRPTGSEMATVGREDTGTTYCHASWKCPNGCVLQFAGDADDVGPFLKCCGSHVQPSLVNG